MKKSILFLSFVLTFVLCTANTNSPDWVTCPSPSNVSKVGETSNSISFDWDDCGCASTGYEVSITRNGTETETFSASSSDFTFANLEVGSYEFRFYTDCGGVLSAPVIIDDIVQQ